MSIALLPTTSPRNIIRAQTQKSQGTPEEPGLKPSVPLWRIGAVAGEEDQPCTKPSRDIREGTQMSQLTATRRGSTSAGGPQPHGSRYRGQGPDAQTLHRL